MSDTFGRLTDVAVRDAWADEARHFTPWLAQNLERIGEVIGIQLELIQAEAGLPTTDDYFSADILARNLQDNSNILIENQLEISDHRHLGQLLTYLTGLEARTVIWVAPSFREAHLAVLKWLNEHTDEEFSFFAIRARVVRIGDSQFAPLFEVLEKPNAWERRLQNATRAAKQLSPEGVNRRAFWQYFLDQYPEHAVDGAAGGVTNRWHKVSVNQLVISYYIAKNEIGLFVRGFETVPPETVQSALESHRTRLETELGVKMHGLSPGKYFFVDSRPGNYTNRDQWSQLCGWLDGRLKSYTQALSTVI